MSLVNDICGQEPVNYIKANPSGSDYVFKNDPNFIEINLYDFLGNGATVNSFIECAYYVDGGWSPYKTTIFDLFEYGLKGLIVSIFIVTVYKFKFFKKIKDVNIKKTYKKISKNNTIKSLLFGIFFITQSFFLFNYVKNKALRIPIFIDEYISLTSNVEFFKNLNFTAGDFLGGSYSIYLTSGPISALGSVIGWNVTNNIFIARISNYYWILVIQICFIMIFKFRLKKDINFLILSSGFIILLFPWWQGYLYSLGEVASILIFTNAMFLFERMRNFSLVLFSIAIFYGKLLTLLPFLGFYFLKVINERKLHKIFVDFLYFMFPLGIWFVLVILKYENGSILDYLYSMSDLIFNHQSSGVSVIDGSDQSSLLQSLYNSEYVEWNIYEKIRILVIPVIFILIILIEKQEISKHFHNLTLPLIGSVILPYIWFWLLSPTKWIRYSQHFTVIVLISFLYFLQYEILKKNISYILVVGSIGIFIDDSKVLIYYLIIGACLLVFFKNKDENYNKLKIFVLLILSINFFTPYFETTTYPDMSKRLISCESTLLTNECREAYFDFWTKNDSS